MSTKHTPEPWFHVYHHGCSFVTDAPLPESGKWNGNTIATESTNIRAVADHARIVQCVNACQGIDDPAAAVKALRFCVQAIRTAGLDSVPGGICAQAYDEAMRALGEYK